MLKNKLIIILTGIYIFWLCILPSIITNTVKVLCKNLSYNSPYNITVVNPHTQLSVLPILTFSADSINISATNDSADLELQNFKIKLRLLPLLSGKLHINSLKTSSFELTANLTKNLELDKDFFEKIEKTNIQCNSLEIEKHKINFYPKEFNYPISFSGNELTYQRKNRYIKLVTDSTLNFGKNNSAIKLNLFLPKNNDINKTIFDVNVQTLDIAPLRTYLKHYLPSDLQEIKGKVDISANKDELVTELTDCAFVMKDPAKSMILPNRLSIKSKFQIKRKSIDFENLSIESKNLHANISGKVIDYFGKTMPTLSLKVRVDKSRVEDFISILPPLKFEEINLYKLKKYKFYGDSLANFTVKGRLPEPEITGDIYVNNGILTKPIPNTVNGATIKLNMTGKNVNYDVFVPAGGSEKVWVKGTQEFYNVKYADMTVKSTSSVDLKVAQNVVMPLHEILNFIIGPVPIMDIYGKGNIDIKVKGNRKNPHVWGVFNVKNGDVRFNEMPNLWLKNADAVLKFNDQNAVFSSQNGLVNGKPFSINGNCNLFGKFDFDVVSTNQSSRELYNAIKTASLIPEINKLLPKLDYISGLTDLNLKIYGVVEDIANLKFNENAFIKGNIKLSDNNFVFQNVKVEQTNGNISFDTNSVDTDIIAQTAGQPLSLKGKIKNNIADIILNVPKLNPNFILPDENLRTYLILPYVSINGKYKGTVDNIEYDNLNIEAKILDSNSNSNIQFYPAGLITLSKNKIHVKNVRGFVEDKKNSFDINLYINNAFSKQPETNGVLNFKTNDLSSINVLLASRILPQNIKNYTKDYEFQSGNLNLNAKIINNKPICEVNLSGISFVYLPLDLPIEIINGSLSVKNNIMKFNKVNILADKMPILADGEIKDIFDKKIFNLYLNSKPRQDFIDKYINKNQIYPIKIKGDIVYWVRLKGTPSNYDLKAKMNMSKDSSLYHFGATIGDVENAIEVSLDSEVKSSISHKIKEFSYDKIIDSQNGKQTKLNLLKANGGVKILKDDLEFDNLHIKTTNPTDARIFNIIFRKPNLKQGQFTSDLRFNGKLSNPRVLGNFHIFEANLPFLDTAMKNIELVFKDKTIEIKSKGEIIGNEITFYGVLQNKLTLPYKIEKAFLYTKDLDLNQIVNKLKVAQMENASTVESYEGFNLKSITAQDFRLKADNIRLRNIHATDFDAITSLSDKGMFDVNKFRFNIASGTLEGRYTYNFANSETGLKLNANRINANDITLALFDLDNQIYGDLTGTVNLTCRGESYNRCMETLNGKTEFNVANGKMPKLGSLEYLLKAGNLVKGGLTGISINSVIDLITPLKTGEFSNIYGLIKIKEGVADNIEITTKGKDLSLFIGGTYNFSTSNADMEVFGLLSRKISTMFGPIGNISINTLFNVIPGIDLTNNSPVLERINRIPGIELSDKSYRKFVAEIIGNINGDDYVKSFKWIN